MYLYLHTTLPLQVTPAAGVEVDPTSIALTVLPHASVMFAGAPGSVATAGQLTVDCVLAGVFNNPPLYTT